MVNDEKKEMKEQTPEEKGEDTKETAESEKASETRQEAAAEPAETSRGGEALEKPEKNGDNAQEEEEDFGALLEQSVKTREISEGEVVRGVVVGITKDMVMVDIGDKSEGQVPIQEFLDESGNPRVELNQEIDVLVEKREEEGLRLSRLKAEKRKTWEQLESAYREGRPVPGKVVERVKGGLIVDVGVPAFMPGSQADLRPVRNLERFIGLEDRFLIVKFNRRRGNVVVSRRELLEKEQEEKRKQTLAQLEKGKVMKGVVKNITEYGAFVDLGGVDGLLHITDMSWGRLGHPSEVVKVGEEITVKVIKFNPETQKVSLSLKELLPDPWETVDKKYPIGTIVMGKVVSVTDYGAFVELEKGVEGLVHVSEMSWTKKRVHPSKIVQPGQEVEAYVQDIDLENRRISLSMKRAQENPWDVLERKYPENTRIRGKIKNITNFGVFVGVEEGIDGLVHISDLSWTKRVKHPSELFKKGDEVECVVLKIDKENERFSLGIKQAQEDPWEKVPDKYRPGDDVTGKVVNITDFGVFVELEEGIEGLIHVSELSHEKVKDPTELVQVGQEIQAEILNVDVSERKIRLSVKALQKSEEAEAYRKYQRQEGDGTSKLGELIREKLKKIKMQDKAQLASQIKEQAQVSDSQETARPKEEKKQESPSSELEGGAKEAGADQPSPETASEKTEPLESRAYETADAPEGESAAAEKSEEHPDAEPAAAQADASSEESREENEEREKQEDSEEKSEGHNS